MEVDRHIATSLAHRAYELGQDGNHEGAIQTYSSILDRYQRSKDPDVVHTVAAVMDNLALEFAQVGRHAEANRLLDRLITEHSDSSDPEWQKAVRHAQISKMLVERSSPFHPTKTPEQEFSGGRTFFHRRRSRRLGR
jgi:hypothetical protein